MNILVLTSPRTASTTYMELLSNLYHLDNCFEPHPLYAAHSPYARELLEKTTARYLNNKNSVLKIHAGHITEFVPHRDKGWFQNILDHTDDIHFLLRRDMCAQIKSLFVGTYYANNLNVDNIHDHFHDSWHEELVIPDTPENRQRWQSMELLLHTNLTGLTALYHMLIDRNPKVVWTEDLANQTQSGKLNRPVIFEWEPEYLYRPENWMPSNIQQIFASDKDKF